MLHLALVTFLFVATPALALVAAFTARTQPHAFLLMPDVSEMETKRMRSVK